MCVCGGGVVVVMGEGKFGGDGGGGGGGVHLHTGDTESLILCGEWRTSAICYTLKFNAVQWSALSCWALHNCFLL